MLLSPIAFALDTDFYLVDIARDVCQSQVLVNVVLPEQLYGVDLMWPQSFLTGRQHRCVGGASGASLV